MKTVFFYGLFMDEALLLDKGLNPKGSEIAVAEGYRLKIGARATLVLEKNARCFGTIMQIHEDELLSLYSGDGVEDYQSHSITVRTNDNKTMQVETFLLPVEMLTGTNSAYAVKLAEIATKLNLPAGYVEEIRTWI